LYRRAVTDLSVRYSKLDINEFSRKYLINIDPSNTTRYIGFSIQQYSKRKFASGQRAVKAYEDVIKQMPDAIVKHLHSLTPSGIDPKDLHLGDIPYVYSLVPLSQTSKIPIFDLTFQNGIRGNQTYSVDEYVKFIKKI